MCRQQMLPRSDRDNRCRSFACRHVVRLARMAQQIAEVHTVNPSTPIAAAVMTAASEIAFSARKFMESSRIGTRTPSQLTGKRANHK